MPAPLLKQLFADLDKANLRIGRPARFVFLCGGKTDVANPKIAYSLRQYLLNERALATKLKGEVVLAETANQLYRDTSYGDLISFEEDIAQLSASVMVITESAGSLAELGAFTANDRIRPRVSIVSQSQYANAESFVRFGPIERIRNDDADRVAFFPWTKNKSDQVVKSSVRSHVAQIVLFINNMIAKVPAEESYGNASVGLRDHINMLWLLQLSVGLSITELISLYEEIFDEEVTQSQAKNRLYCLKIAGWADVFEYSNKSYWYAVRDFDPFVKYRYKQNVEDTNSFLRRSAAAKEILTWLHHPNQVLKHIRRAKGDVP